MFAVQCVYVFTILCVVMIITRLLHLVFFRHGRRAKKACCYHPVKTMIILGSGGHTAEIIRILKHLNFENYSPRLYIHARTDKISVEKIKELERDNANYRIVDVFRSREVNQSYFTSVFTTVRALLESLRLLWIERPNLILCNGPGTCVPLCFIAFLLNLFFISKVIIVFVESFCRVKTLSLTGKILYYIADHVIVQWPYLSKPLYGRTSYI